jgi:TolA-binding protein
VALARRGDIAAAQTIARYYLRRYPNGLRRAEAEFLLR